MFKLNGMCINVVAVLGEALHCMSKYVHIFIPLLSEYINFKMVSSTQT